MTLLSRPAWGAWIEIETSCRRPCGAVSSRPAWGAWIEICWAECADGLHGSRPAWGAWIEMPTRT